MYEPKAEVVCAVISLKSILKDHQFSIQKVTIEKAVPDIVCAFTSLHTVTTKNHSGGLIIQLAAPQVSIRHSTYCAPRRYTQINSCFLLLC